MRMTLEDISATLVVQHVVLKSMLLKDPQLLAHLRANRAHFEDGLATLSVSDTWLERLAQAFDEMLSP